MAPGRKAVVIPAENPNELILQYLEEQNRPYSAADISSNLHNKVTKTKTDKILKEMLERSEVSGTSSGKQWVFWCLQGSKDAATPAELADLDASITAVRKGLSGLRAEVKAKSALVATLRAAPTTAALRESIEELQRKRRESENRLRALREGGVKPVGEEEKQRVERNLSRWRLKREQRRKWFAEIEGLLLDAGMGKEEIWVSLPPCFDVL
ncbi:MAG: hypothetical protein M1818_004417 [Claussenomyces sp. TS43310]|nr:MAG: hypothetical protein M1818_004417 [Claussenomyces sp. TS43310]